MKSLPEAIPPREARGPVPGKCVFALLCSLALLLGLGAEAWAGNTPRRDEFGLVPEDSTDRDLSLPDRVLDRGWPGTPPGAAGVPVPKVAPDEAEIDPFNDYEPAPMPSPQPQEEEDGEEAEQPTRPYRPPVGPDGHQDPGTPVTEPEPSYADVLEYDDHEPSEIEMEENLPSPLDYDDEQFNDEAGDPAEW